MKSMERGVVMVGGRGENSMMIIRNRDFFSLAPTIITFPPLQS